jgi:hypothetical protein
MAFTPREVVTFRDVTLVFKNFTGEAKKYNTEGDRNFSILLGEEDALDMIAQGWNPKALRRQEEDTEQNYHLKVKVNFSGKPPQIWLISNIDPETGKGRSRTMLGGDMVGILDQLESTKVDLVISPYNWEVRGESGRTAYLQSLYFTIYEDELAREYSDVEQVSVAGNISPPMMAIESGREGLLHPDAIDAEEVAY